MIPSVFFLVASLAMALPGQDNREDSDSTESTGCNLVEYCQFDTGHAKRGTLMNMNNAKANVPDWENEKMCEGAWVTKPVHKIAC
jgi:hypothetical protein